MVLFSLLLVIIISYLEKFQNGQLLIIVDIEGEFYLYFGNRDNTKGDEIQKGLYNVVEAIFTYPYALTEDNSLILLVH